MNIEFEMLKAQHEALRNYFISLLPYIFRTHPDEKLGGSKTWLAKYFLWRFERENLAPLDYTQSLSSHEKAPIDHRRFQLQVLMDVAYIRGGLEGYDIVRKVSQDAQALADIVYSRSDGSEADMCRVIDEIYNS
ncbi:hypothetical protein E7745_14350 [Duncaniella sp. C9]|uniref:hypothetical protein n=1 Tax=unclassified Duncaniella TaxID=2649562 RepID=UPI0010A57EFC|nr:MULTISPECIES: hypothetical protein [unclassified Duncaniella]QCD40610.1 hypothetical protein E7745_14350 [Duncaniella sp. C9]QCP71715.1 hypothetical protein FDZ78_03590 [Duncaniella sp. B8]